MPEFIIPAEADKCPYCGKTLYNPPIYCCEVDLQQRLKEIAQEWKDWECSDHT